MKYVVCLDLETSLNLLYKWVCIGISLKSKDKSRGNELKFLLLSASNCMGNGWVDWKETTILLHEVYV